MDLVIQPMTMADYEESFSLWQQSEGVGISSADSPDGIARFLERNPDLSFVARDGERLVGTVLCAQDGRRGYLYHLAVSADYRRRGIGKTLVDRSLAALERLGIEKCHLFVLAGNKNGLEFWTAQGWTGRVDLIVMSHNLNPQGQASG